MSAMNGEGGDYQSNQSNFVLCSQHRVSFLIRYLILKSVIFKDMYYLFYQLNIRCCTGKTYPEKTHSVKTMQTPWRGVQQGTENKIGKV